MRVAINGYGRIGRCLLRAAMQREDCAGLEFLFINEPASAESIAYLTRYDSTHGLFPGSVSLEGNRLRVEAARNSALIDVCSVEHPDANCWQSYGIDILLDCSGAYGSPALARRHIEAGAERVLLSYPGEAGIPAIVFGVNHSDVGRDAMVYSAASCTSNALVAVLAPLHGAYGVRQGVVTTIHSSMHDQPVIDAYHSTDLRKNRAAGQSIIPVDTGLAAGVGRIMPELAGRLIAHALRVPVANVSALNVTLDLDSDISVSVINETLEAEARARLQGVLDVTREPLASCDFIGNLHSAIVDAAQTNVVGQRTVNLLIWFDNEWAFANRMLDIALYLQQQ